MAEKNDKKFDWDICGHKKIIEFLQLSITNRKIAQAYLFSGPAQLGKYSVAKKFIASIFCQGQSKIIPCNDCLHCRQLLNNIHPDVFFIKRETDEKTGKLRKDISVDQIRKLKGSLQQASLLDSYKVAIIPEAQYINGNSANALLKALEEPTAKTVIILITNDINKIPPTIVSRCQRLKFLPVASEQIRDYLKIKNIKEPDKLARLAANRPGLALTFWESEELRENHSFNVGKFLEIIDASTDRRFALAEELTGWTSDETLNANQVNKLVADWQLVVRDFLLLNCDKESLVSNLDFLASFKKYLAAFPSKKIGQLLKSLAQVKFQLNQNVNSKLVLENLIINL
ncbi:MAG: DNA polymerase III subunit delta' [Patescibacteria group bacterium]